MSYQKNVWKKKDRITSAKLNNIEEGIDQAHQQIGTIKQDVIDATTLVAGNKAKIEENARAAEEAAAHALTCIQANTELIVEQADQARAHIQAADEVIAQLNGRVDAVANIKVTADQALELATSHESSIQDLNTCKEQMTAQMVEQATLVEHVDTLYESLSSRESYVEQRVAGISTNIDKLKLDLADIQKNDGVIDTKVKVALVPYLKTEVYQSDIASRLSTLQTTLSTRIEACELSVSALPSANDLSAQSSRIDQLSSDLYDITDAQAVSIESLEDDLASLETRFQAATSTIEDNTARITEAVASIKKNASDIADQAQAASERIQAAEETVSHLNEGLDEIVTLKTTIAAIPAQTDEKITTALSPYLTTAAYEQDQTTRESFYAETYLTSSVITPITAKLDTLENNFETANSTISTVKTNLENQQTLISTLSTRTLTQQDKISTLENATTSLDQRATYLSTQTTELRTSLAEHTAVQHLKTNDFTGLVAISGTNVSRAEHVITTEKSGKKHTARIWNESSGGGLQFTNETTNKIAFLGINNGSVDNDIWAQFYAKDRSTNVGTRMNFTDHGVYMTCDCSNSAYTDDDKLIVSKDLTTVNDVALLSKVRSSKALANIDALLDRLQVLEEQVASLKQENVGIMLDTVISQDTSYTDTSKDLIISGGQVLNTIASFDQRSIDVRSTLLSGARINLTATSGDVTISKMTSTSSLDKSVSNAAASINTNEYVKITNCELQQLGYNSIEIGLSNTAPKSIIIDRVNFGQLTNNCILIFATQDDTTVTISNCHVASCSNFLRISNRDQARNVTINIVNCQIDHIDQDPDWRGLIIFEDYLKGTAAEVADRNLFSPERIRVNIVNTTVEGYALSSIRNIASVCGTRNSDQLFYIWNNYGASTSENVAEPAFLPYDVSSWPEIHIYETRYSH